MVGDNLLFPPNGSTGLPEWTLVSTSTSSIGPVIGGAVTGTFIATLLIVSIPLICAIVIFYYRKNHLNSKYDIQINYIKLFLYV